MSERRPHDAALLTVLWFSHSGVNDSAACRTVVEQCPGPVAAVGPALDDSGVGQWYPSEAGVLDRIAADHPEHAILLLRVGLVLPPRFFTVVDAVVDDCRELLPHCRTVVFPGNYDLRVDPFAGLGCRTADLETTIYWIGDRCGQWLQSPPSDCLLFAAGIASGEPAATGARRALLIDDGYVVDPAIADGPESIAPADDEAMELPPLGHLRMRAESLLTEGLPRLPRPDDWLHGRLQDRQVTLHIAHSWGGGVWQWIADLAAGDPGQVHLVLVAASDGPGRTCGRVLKLCAAGPGRGVIREFALSPMIEAVADRHEAYAQHLKAIIARFDVARIVVSSLVGHSLDCLRTGIPTLVVLHDFFPLWPLLDRDPMPFIKRDGGDPDRARTTALREHPDSMRFQPGDPEYWNDTARAWIEALKAYDLALCAPTQHVIESILALAPDAGLKVDRVPHGFRPFEAMAELRPPEVGAPLHLLIPGRLSTGKGRALLQQALPRLAAKFADRLRLTALGCGREGLALMGRAGIDLVPEYRREDLPKLVAELRPHAALLLSTVPETWSYTLSEMRALGLVPVATRVGSFAERIEHDRDGILFEPDADALVATIERLAADPERLTDLARAARPERTLAEVVADIDRICPGCSTGGKSAAGFRPMAPPETTWAMQAGQLATARARAARARREHLRMQVELEKRTRWAETMERQFRGRTEWARRLEAQVLDLGQALERQDREYHELSDRYRDLNAEHTELAGQYQELAQQHDQLRQRHEALGRQHEALGQQHEQLQEQFNAVINSRSWKLTRPLRFVRRVVTRKRLRQLANPLQWIRMTRVFLFYWRSQGFRGALDALQHPPREEPQNAAFSEEQLARPDDVTGPVRLDASDQPVASVIIPVYNQLAYTASCLQSIASAATQIDFEVVVVDDASSDDTRSWLEQCSGVEVLRNRRNKGFIATCNRGAKRARGRYLVFLNNDTRVTDGWLDALIATFEKHPDAGIVGARLVFADGTLQEAGGIVFRDGSGWNFGRGDNPDRPVYGFVSEADYVSGACLAIASDRFQALGGFDTHYAPAYYEDTDLCFKVRQAGLKVLYQPAATVIHFEGATSGTDESTGAKRYQAVNRDKLRERWADVLQAHPDNPGEFSTTNARHYRYRRFQHTALVIDAVTPMPDHDSGSMRMFAMLQLLGELGYRPSFMPQNLAWSGRHSVDLQQAGVEVLTGPWVHHPEQWLAEFGHELDLIIVSRHYVLAPMLKMLRKFCPQARLVFDTVDLHFLREQREAELTGKPSAVRAAKKTKNEELALIREADATLVVSEFERKLLAELTPSARVSVVSNIHSLQPPGKPFDQRDGLVFVGGFQHPPNRDAADWLIDGILPEVRRELPEITVHIIGSNMPDELKQRQAPGVRIHGFVADLEPFMSGCRISVAPLRYGAGVKGKVNQAMSHGLPVVATRCAAEGMYVEHDRDILIADDASSFAAEVCRLYRDRELWQRLAENGRINVEQYFSLDAARKALQALLAELEVDD